MEHESAAPNRSQDGKCMLKEREYCSFVLSASEESQGTQLEIIGLQPATAARIELITRKTFASVRRHDGRMSSDAYYSPYAIQIRRSRKVH